MPIAADKKASLFLKVQKQLQQVPSVCWIILLAFLIRISYLLAFPPPPVNFEGDDGLYYVTALQIKNYIVQTPALLKELLGGHLFQGGGILERYGLEIPWGALRRGPVYPAFAAVLFLIFQSVTFVCVVQALLSSLASGLLLIIGKMLRQPLAGLIAAATASLHPAMIYFTSQMMQESLGIFLLLLFFTLWIRNHRSDSPAFFAQMGFLLFVLSFAKSGLAFFPFAFAGAVLIQKILQRNVYPSWKSLSFLSAAFIFPYLIWMAVVSYQFHSPGKVIIVDNLGRELWAMNVPRYEGWLPDVFLMPEMDENTARLLEQEGVAVESTDGRLLWPDDIALKKAAQRRMLKNPWDTLLTHIEKVRKLWWHPFPGNAEGGGRIPHSVYPWLHRGLIVTALLGGCLWFFEKPSSLWVLILAPLYGAFLHSFFHVELRYQTVYLPVLFLFSGFFLAFLWNQRDLLFGGPRRILVPLVFIAGAGLFYYGDTRHLLLIFPSAGESAAQVAANAIKSACLAALFIAGGFWLRSAVPGKILFASVSVSALFVLIPYEIYAWTSPDWLEWKSPLGSSGQIVRQEIVLPRSSLRHAAVQNIRMDIALPAAFEAKALIRVNGKDIATAENLKEEERLFPVPAYSVRLDYDKKPAYAIRQWHKLALPPGVLRENAVNTVEIELIHDPEPGAKQSALKELFIFGDYQPAADQDYIGPLFQRFPSETSFFKYLYDGDFRLRGQTRLHHKGARSLFYTGGKWYHNDLSLAPGIQKGQYRIRIEIETGKGEYRIY